MKLSLPPKLVEKPVWVLFLLLCKILIPSYAFDAIAGHSRSLIARLHGELWCTTNYHMTAPLCFLQLAPGCVIWSRMLLIPQGPAKVSTFRGRALCYCRWCGMALKLWCHLITDLLMAICPVFWQKRPEINQMVAVGYIENNFSLDVAILILLCSQLASDNLKGFVCSSGYIFFQNFHLISHWILNNVTWWQWVLQHGSGRCCDYWIGRIYDLSFVS
jgi:hypothetical protein